MALNSSVLNVLNREDRTLLDNCTVPDMLPVVVEDGRDWRIALKEVRQELLRTRSLT